MVAGEASGDMLAAPLLQAIRQRWPQAQCAGIGGAQMQAQGFEVWWGTEVLDVQGIVQILRAYARLWRLRRAVVQRALDFQPDVFIGVDAPEFNLGVEQRLHARGIKTVHYISPSIWAWRAGRLRHIRRAVDHMLCLYPFEKALYDAAAVAATFVGHPLASQLQPVWHRAAAQTALGLDHARPVLALLPGSRSGEVAILGPRFLATCQLLLARMPQLQIVLPAAPQRYAALRKHINTFGLQDRIQLLDGQSHTALAACDVALIASGTATLEAMLTARPMVIAYAMPTLSFHVIKWLSTTAWVGLPNILSKRKVVPEFLQDAATPLALANAVLEWFEQPAKVRALQQHFAAQHHLLQRDSALLACETLAQVLLPNSRHANTAPSAPAPPCA